MNRMSIASHFELMWKSTCESEQTVQRSNGPLWSSEAVFWHPPRIIGHHRHGSQEDATLRVETSVEEDQRCDTHIVRKISCYYF